MQIGPPILMIEGPHLVLVFSLGLTQFLGGLKSSELWLGPIQRPGTVALLLLLQKFHGFNLF